MRNEFLYRLGAHGVCIAAAGAGVGALVSAALVGSISLTFVAISFLIVFASYRIDYLAEPETRAAAGFDRQRALNSAITAIAFLAAFAYLLKASRVAAMASLPFPAATYFYTRPLFPRLARPVKEWPLFKAVYTSACWGGLVGFGMVYFGVAHVAIGAWLFLFTFLRMIVNSVACDFKDAERDRHRGVLTVPVVFGKDRTLKLLHAVNVAAALLIVLVILLGVAPPAYLWLVLSALWPYAYLRFIRHGGADLRWLSATVVDVEFLLWIPLLLLATA